MYKILTIVWWILLGDVLKRRPQSAWVSPVQWGHFADKRGVVLPMRTSALFGAKNFGLFEIYGVSARIRGEGGWASTDDILRTKGEGSIFCDFVQTSFMDSLLQHYQSELFEFNLQNLQKSNLNKNFWPPTPQKNFDPQFVYSISRVLNKNSRKQVKSLCLWS